jgi:hypothetical protein|tara:strand:+ start:181 stop:339 length:159 start_codon:yes stop_codon:yes gene_type:complete
VAHQTLRLQILLVVEQQDYSYCLEHYFFSELDRSGRMPKLKIEKWFQPENNV